MNARLSSLLLLSVLLAVPSVAKDKDKDKDKDKNRDKKDGDQ